MNIDWSKAPEGATHFSPVFKTFDPLWAKLGSNGKFQYMPIDCSRAWYDGAQPCFGETYIERAESWAGTGLPPVGQKCEIISDDTGEWIQGVILVHCRDEGKDLAILQGDDVVWMGEAHEFRPLRTKEQIEAEERERIVSEMYMLFYSKPDTGKEAMYRLYDAGYRKQSTCDPVGYDD